MGHRRRFPATALTAIYMTDFPTVYLERPLSKFIGGPLAGALGRAGYAYCRFLYRRFDLVLALSETGGAAKLRALGIGDVDVLPLGVELEDFRPSRRDPALRRELGLTDDQPLLIYVGRLDGEKKPDVVVEAFRKLPRELGARLVLLGDGPLRGAIEALGDRRILMPGYVAGRPELARWLASADIYVSAMADETFGVSIIEAQASGLPVVGVAAGAMIDRVGDSIGRLGPVGDSDAMAANVVAIWNSDRASLAKRARGEALNYSWERTMELLFGRFYLAAVARRSDDAAHAATAAQAAA
jgi:alpha-1,6-mannosyltransferase